MNPHPSIFFMKDGSPPCVERVLSLVQFPSITLSQFLLSRSAAEITMEFTILTTPEFLPTTHHLQRHLITHLTMALHPCHVLHKQRMRLLERPPGHLERIIPSSTLMNVILHAFVHQRDYVGAFVALASYSRFNVPLDHRTYYRVHRIWLEVSEQYRGEVGWSMMFLGVPDYRLVTLNEDLVKNLLEFVSQDTFHLISPLYASHRHMPPLNVGGRYKLPSMEMMESVFLPNPTDFHYDPILLKRILRCAILAKLCLEDENTGPAEISKAIADAKADILPKIPQHTCSSVSHG